MFRRLLAAVCVCLIAPIVVSQPAADAQPDAPHAANTAASYGDARLVAALDRAGLITAWLDASPVSDEAALLEVDAVGTYAENRHAFLDSLEELGERRAIALERDSRLDEVEAHIARLDTLTRSLRRDFATHGRSAAVSLTSVQAERARFMLSTISASRAQWSGFALDPVAQAEAQLVVARKRIAREVEVLRQRTTPFGKSTDAAVARLTVLHSELDEVRSLVSLARQRDIVVQFGLASDRSDAIAQMADLHQERLLLPSAVAGLPVVTVDAYVRGAAGLEASCPVDWSLLAGIGRVESFHGTIGDSAVQQSGRVTTAIFGPLLDGGATEREAAEAEAEAAAQAEAAALLEEQERLEAEALAAEFNAKLYGLDLEELAAEAAAELEEEPLYDPQLWGEVDLPDDDAAEDEDADGGETDDEEPELLGNGFAVIEDSDNGRLDGNDRWDRAVGPMQFIPETWSYFATDGNGDGVADPQNLYDSAATAGRFLCHLSRSRGASPQTFILGYNSSQTYVRNVLSFAESYRSGSLP